MRDYMIAADYNKVSERLFLNFLFILQHFLKIRQFSLGIVFLLNSVFFKNIFDLNDFAQCIFAFLLFL